MKKYLLCLNFLTANSYCSPEIIKNKSTVQSNVAHINADNQSKIHAIFNQNNKLTLERYQTTEQKKLACFLLLLGTGYYFDTNKYNNKEYYYATIAASSFIDSSFLMLQPNTINKLNIIKDLNKHTKQEDLLLKNFHTYQKILQPIMSTYYIIKPLILLMHTGFFLLDKQEHWNIILILGMFSFLHAYNNYYINKAICSYEK